MFLPTMQKLTSVHHKPDRRDPGNPSTQRDPHLAPPARGARPHAPVQRLGHPTRSPRLHVVARHPARPVHLPRPARLPPRALAAIQPGLRAREQVLRPLQPRHEDVHRYQVRLLSSSSSSSSLKRFLRNNLNSHRFSWEKKADIVFSLGGDSIAYAQLYIVLACVLRRFEVSDFDVVYERDIKAARDCFIGEPSLESLGVRVKMEPVLAGQTRLAG